MNDLIVVNFSNCDDDDDLMNVVDYFEPVENELFDSDILADVEHFQSIQKDPVTVVVVFVEVDYSNQICDQSLELIKKQKTKLNH